MGHSQKGRRERGDMPVAATGRGRASGLGREGGRGGGGAGRGRLAAGEDKLALAERLWAATPLALAAVSSHWLPRSPLAPPARGGFPRRPAALARCTALPGAEAAWLAAVARNAGV
jgi:hypothetical protein